MRKQVIKIQMAAPKARNPMARELASTLYRPRKVRSKKVYSRKSKPGAE